MFFNNTADRVAPDTFSLANLYGIDTKDLE